MRGFGHVFGGRNLTFRTNNYSLFFALRFGDLRDGSFQTFRQDNIFQLDALDVDAPWIGGGINCLFDALANFLLVRKEFVQRHFADGVAHCGLGQLRDGVEKVLNLQDRLFGVIHAELNDRVNPDRNIVARDRFLIGNVHSLHANVDFDKSLEYRNQNFPARIPRCLVFAHQQDNTALILVDLFDKNNCDNQKGNEKAETTNEFHNQQCIGNLLNLLNFLNSF